MRQIRAGIPVSSELVNEMISTLRERGHLVDFGCEGLCIIFTLRDKGFTAAKSIISKYDPNYEVLKEVS